MGVVVPKMLYIPQWVETDYIKTPILDSAEALEVRHLISKWKVKQFLRSLAI